MIGIENGTRVLVFEEDSTNPFEYNKGVIVDRMEEDDEEWLITYYKILLDNGSIITSMHLNSLPGYSYFRTYDEHINKIRNESIDMLNKYLDLNIKIHENNRLIRKLEKEKSNN